MHTEVKSANHATERPGRSTEESLRNLWEDDTEHLARAMHEYREASWDDSSFENLPAETQHAILSRAQKMKALAIRLRGILKYKNTE